MENNKYNINQTTWKLRGLCWSGRGFAKMIIACGGLLPHWHRTWWAESSSHCLKHPTITHVNGKSISYPHRPDDHHQSSDQSTGPCLVTTSIQHRRRRQDGWAKSSNKAHHFPSTHTLVLSFYRAHLSTQQLGQWKGQERNTRTLRLDFRGYYTFYHLLLIS